MNKQIKVEKKKAQYSRRLRAFEEQVWKLQELTKHQDNYIQYLLRELSTTRTLYQQPDNQTPTLPQSQETIGTTQELTPSEPQTQLERSPTLREESILGREGRAR